MSFLFYTYNIHWDSRAWAIHVHPHKPSAHIATIAYMFLLHDADDIQLSEQDYSFLVIDAAVFSGSSSSRASWGMMASSCTTFSRLETPCAFLPGYEMETPLR